MSGRRTRAIDMPLPIRVAKLRSRNVLRCPCRNEAEGDTVSWYVRICLGGRKYETRVRGETSEKAERTREFGSFRPAAGGALANPASSRAALAGRSLSRRLAVGVGP